MTTKPVYPLEQVLDVKKNRVKKQEKIVKEKQQERDREQEKLKKAEEERDTVAQHYKDKLEQLRNEMDHGTTADKIHQMKVYMKIVKDKLEIEKKKVKDQEEQVKIAEQNLKEAKEELRKKRQDVDKLETHRKDWMKKMQKELDIAEAKEQDEIGSTMYTLHQRKKM